MANGRVGAGIVHAPRVFTPIVKINETKDLKVLDRRMRERALDIARDHYLAATAQYRRGLITREEMQKWQAKYEKERGRKIGDV